MASQLRRLVEGRWFALTNLLIVLGSGAIWYFRPEYGWKILLIALLPWGIRLLAGKAPFRFSAFDLPILIFLITAFIGAQAAYDQHASWAKFWLIVGSALLFYALATQPRENTWLIVASISVLGVLITLYYLMVYDWQARPVRVELVNRIGRAWMDVRPFNLPALIKDEDIISNILLVLFPFPIFLFFHTLQDRIKKRWNFILAIIATVLFLIGLGMAATREAILFFLIGFIFVIWWWVNIRLERGGFELVRRIFWIVSGLVVICGLFLLIRTPDGVLGLIQDSPINNQFQNRLSVIDNTLHLSKDFPFTGGGLGSFPGLYSKYILVIPYLFISYGSNLFLQIAVEHGVIGSLVYLSILVGGALIIVYRLLRKSEVRHQHQLIFLCLGGYFALLVVGMMDAILYTGPGIFFLFLIPGFATFALDQPQGRNLSLVLPSVIFGASLLVFLLSWGGNLKAAYYANLGAVEMAQIDLTGWHGEGAIQAQPAERYDHTLTHFDRALEVDQGNRTANYRMGLLEMNQAHFEEGCLSLEKANELDPGNRGIVKNLGFCYAWEGDINSAVTYLQRIPEAKNELKLYVWWWGTQNRNDLSGYASQVEKRLIKTQQKGNN